MYSTHLFSWRPRSSLVWRKRGEPTVTCSCSAGARYGTELWARGRSSSPKSSSVSTVSIEIIWVILVLYVKEKNVLSVKKPSSPPPPSKKSHQYFFTRHAFLCFFAPFVHVLPFYIELSRYLPQIFCFFFHIFQLLYLVPFLVFFLYIKRQQLISSTLAPPPSRDGTWIYDLCSSLCLIPVDWSLKVFFCCWHNWERISWSTIYASQLISTDDH